MWWSGRQIVAAVVEIRNGIEIVVVKRRDAGRRVQREFWEDGVVCVEGYGDDAEWGVRRVASLSWIGHETRKGLGRLYVVTVLLGRTGGRAVGQSVGKIHR